MKKTFGTLDVIEMCQRASERCTIVTGGSGNAAIAPGQKPAHNRGISKKTTP